MFVLRRKQQLKAIYLRLATEQNQFKNCYINKTRKQIV